jgi:CRP-like cAMP-binding protein
VLEGFACSSKTSGEGKRQILNFHVPGDFPDLLSLNLDVLDSTLTTISPCRIGFVQHEAIQQISERHPKIARALWRSTLIDAAVFREWVVNVGVRPAYSRIAHLLCEVLVRLRAVGLAQNFSCEFPISQTEIAAATGLSSVHVNRSLQELRANRLIKLDRTGLRALDWEGLQAAGDFDPAYLHLRNRGEPAQYGREQSQARH